MPSAYFNIQRHRAYRALALLRNTYIHNMPMRGIITTRRHSGRADGIFPSTVFDHLFSLTERRQLSSYN